MLQLLLVILNSLAGCLFLLVFFFFFKWKSEHSPCVALKEISHNCSQQKACFKMKALSKTTLGFHTCSRTDVGIVMKHSLLLFGVTVMVHSLEQLEMRLCCTEMLIRCLHCNECWLCYTQLCAVTKHTRSESLFDGTRRKIVVLLSLGQNKFKVKL